MGMDPETIDILHAADDSCRLIIGMNIQLQGIGNNVNRQVSDMASIESIAQDSYPTSSNKAIP